MVFRNHYKHFFSISRYYTILLIYMAEEIFCNQINLDFILASLCHCFVWLRCFALFRCIKQAWFKALNNKRLNLSLKQTLKPNRPAS